MSYWHVLTFPMIMTGMRLLLALGVMPWLVILSVSSSSLMVHVSTATLCLVLCITDFLDGYYARRYGLVTREGAVLDQLSDKIFMATSLLALVSVHRIHVLCAMVVIVREMLMMGLREYALLSGLCLPVQKAGKIKVTVQYIYLFLVLLEVKKWYMYGWLLEQIALIGMIVMTILSAFYYVYRGLRFSKRIAQNVSL